MLDFAQLAISCLLHACSPELWTTCTLEGSHIPSDMLTHSLTHSVGLIMESSWNKPLPSLLLLCPLSVDD